MKNQSVHLEHRRELWYSNEAVMKWGKQRGLDGRLAKSASAMKSPQMMEGDQNQTKMDNNFMSLRGDGCDIEMNICIKISQAFALFGSYEAALVCVMLWLRVAASPEAFSFCGPVEYFS